MKTTILFLLAITASAQTPTQVDYSTQIKNKPIISVVQYGAKGDGVTSDSAAIQKAVTAMCSTGGGIYFPTPTQFYSITAGIQVVSCGNITFSSPQGTVLRVAAGTPDTVYNSWPNYGFDSIFRIVDSTNITVDGLTLDGNLPNRTAHSGGESFNSDVLAAGSTNIRVQNSTLENGMTDGVSVVLDGSSTVNTNVWVQHNQILNNRRLGIAGVGVIHFFVDDNVIAGTGTIQGTPPESGIDIEPDSGTSGQLSQDVHIESNDISTSAGTYQLSVAGRGTNGCTITGNHIHDGADSGVDFDSTGGSYTNTNCTFGSGNEVFNHVAGGSGIGLRVNGPNLDKVEGSTFRNNIAGASVLSAKNISFFSNLFDSNLYEGIAGGGVNEFISINITGNTFKDNFSAAGLSNGATGAAFVGNPASSTSVLVFSGNLVYGTQNPVTTTSPAGVVLTGSCQCFGRGNQSALLNATTNSGNFTTTAGIESLVTPQVLVNATPGTAIASATSITITAPYQHVSGTAAIQNIVFPPGFGSVVSGGAAGCVVIIPDGAFTTITGGSSGTRIYNAITAVANVPVMACYDAGTGGWYMR